MYLPGKILQVGGMDDKAVKVDINAATPVVTDAGRMIARRTWASATVMADGKVAISGGSAVKNVATGVVYQLEIWNPANGSFTPGPLAQQMRLYHHIQMLLPDASVLTAGGGAPGPETNLNAEIYYPPYLFAANGQLGTRPRISAAPTAMNPTSEFVLVSPDAAAIQKVHLIATPSITHSFDMNQRFIPLTFTRSGDQLRVKLPTIPYETPPGFYMVFVLNANGTPVDRTNIPDQSGLMVAMHATARDAAYRSLNR